MANPIHDSTLTSRAYRGGLLQAARPFFNRASFVMIAWAWFVVTLGMQRHRNQDV